ncbi:hypothetical protein HMN09_00920400 [Mycena chlorophos]|uniref:Uncharacterized protein n=1 Tax=Mycena chlorophos TaxID=658473 RepID=A0A8H6SKK2_MYCCL|nr:hypothetical protein HMN09_00920400 [Mycena chlorophos]
MPSSRPRSASPCQPTTLPCTRTPPPATSNKIAKPSALTYGTLATFADWKEGPEEANVLRVTVKQLATKHLDTTQSLTRQAEENVELVKQQALAKHSYLAKYENSWPVEVLLFAVLKITARSAVKREHDDTFDAVQQLALITQRKGSRRLLRKSKQSPK